MFARTVVAPVTVKLVKAVVLPTFPPKITAAFVPLEVTVKFCAPLIIELKVIAPLVADSDADPVPSNTCPP